MREHLIGSAVMLRRAIRAVVVLGGLTAVGISARHAAGQDAASLDDRVRALELAARSTFVAPYDKTVTYDAAYEPGTVTVCLDRMTPAPAAFGGPIPLRLLFDANTDHPSAQVYDPGLASSPRCQSLQLAARTATLTLTTAQASYIVTIRP